MRWNKKAVAGCVILLGLMAAPVTALTLHQPLTSVFVPGADRFGNPSILNGGHGPGKIYKDTFSGIIIVRAEANVDNNYGFAVQFRDLGFLIHDPWARQLVVSDSDVTTLGRAKRGVSSASLVAVNVP